MIWCSAKMPGRNDMDICQRKESGGNNNMKPKCKLIGTDGNVFSIIGKVSDILRKNKKHELAKEFRKKSTECHSYDEVLRLVTEYVEVE